MRPQVRVSPEVSRDIDLLISRAPMLRKVQADPVRGFFGDRVIYNHAQLRPAVHCEGRKFRFEESEFRVMEALRSFACQSALKFDPSSAPKIDPLALVLLRVA